MINIKTLSQERCLSLSWNKFNFKSISHPWHMILLVIWKRSAWAVFFFHWAMALSLNWNVPAHHSVLKKCLAFEYEFSLALSSFKLLNVEHYRVGFYWTMGTYWNSYSITVNLKYKVIFYSELPLNINIINTENTWSWNTSFFATIALIHSWRNFSSDWSCCKYGKFEWKIILLIKKKSIFLQGQWCYLTDSRNEYIYWMFISCLYV